MSPETHWKPTQVTEWWHYMDTNPKDINYLHYHILHQLMLSNTLQGQPHEEHVAMIQCGDHKSVSNYE